jgi:hypothetical protein
VSLFQYPVRRRPRRYSPIDRDNFGLMGSVMRKTDATTIAEMRAFALAQPDQTYRQLAASFGISEISVKRHCADLGRGKNWRRDRKQVEDTGAARLWSAVERLGPDDCWKWLGCINDFGYGVIHFRGKSQGAHCVAYQLTNGEIPTNTELDHLCRNRGCCNPAHLEPVEHDENMRRVRLAQTENGEGVQSHSRGVFDTGPGIDTRENIQIDLVLDRVRTISNASSINPGNNNPGAPAVSMGELAGSINVPLEAELQVSIAGNSGGYEDRPEPENEPLTTLPGPTRPASDRTGDNISAAETIVEHYQVIQTAVQIVTGGWIRSADPCQGRVGSGMDV